MFKKIREIQDYYINNCEIALTVLFRGAVINFCLIYIDFELATTF